MAIWRKNKISQYGENKQNQQKQGPLLETEKKKTHRRRSETMKLRLTPEELWYLTDEAQKAGISRTEYIMASVKGLPVITLEAQSILMELRRQGVNLNQLTKLAHQTGKVDGLSLNVAIQCCTNAQKEITALCKKWNIQLMKRKEGKTI